MTLSKQLATASANFMTPSEMTSSPTAMIADVLIAGRDFGGLNSQGVRFQLVRFSQGDFLTSSAGGTNTYAVYLRS
jgi:hypothetical protein